MFTTARAWLADVIDTLGVWSRIPLYQHRYSKEWDAKLNMILDEVEVSGWDRKSDHTRTYGEYIIWVQNYPYAYGNRYGYGNSRPEPFRPKEKTIARLRRLETAPGPDEEPLEGARAAPKRRITIAGISEDGEYVCVKFHSSTDSVTSFYIRANVFYSTVFAGESVLRQLLLTKLSEYVVRDGVLLKAPRVEDIIDNHLKIKDNVEQ